VISRPPSTTRTLRGIQGLSPTEREAVAARLKDGRACAAAARDESAPPSAVPVDRAFTWPEFDRWQRFFDACGLFPARWDGLEVAPAPQTSPAAALIYRNRKLDLLLEWIDTLVHGAVSFGHYRRQGVRARIVRQGDGGRCPACESFNGHEVRLGGAPMPPIHPGCRCVLVAMTEAPDQERTGTRRRSRRDPDPKRRSP
jgi:hypothetical protein